MDFYNIVSFFGMFVLLGIAWLFSAHRRIVNFRVIGWGIGLQLLFALFIFTIPPGAKLFLAVNNLAVRVMGSAAAGAEFVFGRLAIPPGSVNASGEESLGFILAFQSLPTIIFFSALMAILYYYGIMQRIIGLFARLFTRLMRISGAESLAAASNIFVGVESSLTIRPYLNEMTESELTTLLTAGMATVSSNVLALYVFSLNAQFPTIAAHLISASFLSAPAAIVMSKLIMPETGTPLTLGRTVAIEYQREQSVFEAVINGANAGVRLVVGVAALLIAVLGLVALTDLIIGGIGGWINTLFGTSTEWSLSLFLGYIGYPFALIMGVPPVDATLVGRLIGERVIVTEVTAYQDLARLMAGGLLSNPRSAVITAYALCGFAHLASMAIFIGGISAIAPGVTQTLSRVGFRALLAATLACFMTACVAGAFYTQGSILFGG
jgi:concentrative nucleoside transporter, CNT family